MNENPKTIPYEEDAVPPAGYILVQDATTGDKFWIDPDALHASEPQSDLSDEQVKRVKQAHEVLAEATPIGLEDTLNNFRRDQNPESEIQIFEFMANAYQEELELRGEMTTGNKKTLFRVLLACSFAGGDIGDVLSSCPEAKTLPDLERIVDRWH